MAGRRGRRGRHSRGIYVSPGMVLGLLAVVAAVGLGIWLLGGGEEQPEGPSLPADQTPAGNEDPAGEETPVPQPPEDPTHRTTASGVACTLRDLGEGAVHTGELILVNNWTEYRFPGEQALANVLAEKTKSYYVKDGTVEVAPAAMAALNGLMDGFQAQGGSKTVNVVAGYRTAEFQQHLFDQSVEKNGLEHAQKYVAQPGGSEHHTGYAVDLHILLEDGSSRDYDGTGEYAWINENCRDYGFVVRYDQAKADLTGIYDEPWHFRYVGVPHAAKMVEEDLCLEEYVEYLKDYTFEKPLTITCTAGTYEVWYARGTEIFVPDSGEYTVSGNNVDGLIVTCRVG